MAKLIQNERITQNWKTIKISIQAEVYPEVFINNIGDIEITLGKNYCLNLTAEEARELATDILTMQKGLEEEDGTA